MNTIWYSVDILQKRGVYKMPAPLSNDLRKRIIDAKQRGDTEDKIASEKGVSKSTVTKLWALYRETGSYETRPNPNGKETGFVRGIT
jgi:transposase